MKFETLNGSDKVEVIDFLHNNYKQDGVSDETIVKENFRFFNTFSDYCHYVLGEESTFDLIEKVISATKGEYTIEPDFVTSSGVHLFIWK